MIRKFVIVALCLVALGLSAQSALAVTHTFTIIIEDNDMRIEGLNGYVFAEIDWDGDGQGEYETVQLNEIDEGVYQGTTQNNDTDYLWRGYESHLMAIPVSPPLRRTVWYPENTNYTYLFNWWEVDWTGE